MSKAEVEAASVLAADVFRLLGSVTRMRIIELLHDRGETCVGDIAREVGVLQSNISHDLTSMRLCGLVEPRRKSQRVYYVLTARGMSLAAVAATMSSA